MTNDHDLRSRLDHAQANHEAALAAHRREARELAELETKHGRGPWASGSTRDTMQAARRAYNATADVVDQAQAAVKAGKAELAAFAAQRDHDRALARESYPALAPALIAAGDIRGALERGRAARQDLDRARVELADLTDKIHGAERLQENANEQRQQQAADLDMALRLGQAPKAAKPIHDFAPAIASMRADHADQERRIRDELEPAAKAPEADLARAMQARTLLAALGYFDMLRKIALQHQGAVQALCGAEGVSTPLVSIQLTGSGFRFTFSDPSISAKRFEPAGPSDKFPLPVPTIGTEIAEVFGQFVRDQIATLEPEPQPAPDQAQAAE